MKKIVALSMVLLMLIPTVLASTSLSTKTIEELIQMKTEIEAELLSRNKGQSFGVPPGKYVVGIDFPAGIYKVTISNSSAIGGMIVVYPDKKKMDAEGTYSDMAVLSGMIDNPTIGKLELVDGNGVWVSNGMLTFEVYTGLEF